MRIVPIKYHRRIGMVLAIISVSIIGYAVIEQTVEWRVKNVPILSTQQEKEYVKWLDELRAISKSIRDRYDR